LFLLALVGKTKQGRVIAPVEVFTVLSSCYWQQGAPVVQHGAASAQQLLSAVAFVARGWVALALFCTSSPQQAAAGVQQAAVCSQHDAALSAAFALFMTALMPNTANAAARIDSFFITIIPQI
jgi:hypothetical protein